jgi:predicted deacylase
MRHYGLLSGEIAKIDTARNSAPRLVDARNMEDYSPCPRSGVWEPLIDLGEEVDKGRLIGRLHDFSNQASEPLEIHANRAGVLIMMCAGAVCPEGTTLFVIARDAAIPGSA